MDPQIWRESNSHQFPPIPNSSGSNSKRGDVLTEICIYLLIAAVTCGVWVLIQYDSSAENSSNSQTINIVYPAVFLGVAVVSWLAGLLLEKRPEGFLRRPGAVLLAMTPLWILITILGLQPVDEGTFRLLQALGGSFLISALLSWRRPTSAQRVISYVLFVGLTMSLIASLQLWLSLLWYGASVATIGLCWMLFTWARGSRPPIDYLLGALSIFVAGEMIFIANFWLAVAIFLATVVAYCVVTLVTGNWFATPRRTGVPARVSPRRLLIAFGGSSVAASALIIAIMTVGIAPTAGQFPSLLTHPDPSIHGWIAYTASSTGKYGAQCVELLSASGGQPRDISCPPGNVSFQWLDDGRLAVMSTSMPTGKTWAEIYDPATGKEVEGFSTGTLVNEVSFSQGGLLRTGSLQGGNATFEYAGKKVLQIRGSSDYEFGDAGFSPDHKWLWVNDTYGRTFVLRPNGNNVRQAVDVNRNSDGDVSWYQPGYSDNTESIAALKDGEHLRPGGNYLRACTTGQDMCSINALP